MSKAKSRSIGPELTKAERIAGWIYLPFYLLLMEVCLYYGTSFLGIELTDTQYSGVWFALNLIATLLIFHKFLLRSFRAIRFWRLLQAIGLGAVFYYGGNFIMSTVYALLDLQVISFNDETIDQLAQSSFWLVTVCSVVVAPIVEETLARGLIFGTIRRHSRVVAYLLSTLFFCAIHVVAYIPSQGLIPVLLAASLYLPAGFTLAWAYERANTIWAPIMLHILINSLSALLLQ